MNFVGVGFTSGVFRDPFDVSWESLDVKVVAVKIGALLLSEIGGACRAFLDVARAGQKQTIQKHNVKFTTLRTPTMQHQQQEQNIKKRNQLMTHR